LSMDHKAFIEKLEQYVKKIIQELNAMQVFKAERLFPGPNGQPYPRALARITEDFKAEELAKLMKNSNPGVYIGVSKEHENSIYINPLNLKNSEVEIVIDTLKKCVNKLMN
ncbi:unnamed protein product, partial [marine sediment metagenome]